VDAMKRGADDYIAKGRLQIDEAGDAHSRPAPAKARGENVSLRHQLDSRFGHGKHHWPIAAHEECWIWSAGGPGAVHRAAARRKRHGKELIAKVIHQLSPRGATAMVTVHCAALARLCSKASFRHEKGASPARTSAALPFEQAQGGTLFLDEIGEIDPSIQIKLLRFLGERSFERVGSNKTSARSPARHCDEQKPAGTGSKPASSGMICFSG